MTTRVVGTEGSEPLLRVIDLELRDVAGKDTRTIVSGLNFDVAAGEAVGIVGESGSGKSMTARAITGLLPPGLAAEGRILFGSKDLLTLPEPARRRQRGSEIGFVFQDPYTMLNPVMRAGEHLAEMLRVEGRRSREEIRSGITDILAEVRIDDPRVQHRYPFELSGGLRQRIAIAASLVRRPRLLIVDEPTTALDVTTQREILALIRSLQRARGMGLILITHDLRVAFAMCDRVISIRSGERVDPPAGIEADPLRVDIPDQSSPAPRTTEKGTPLDPAGNGQISVGPREEVEAPPPLVLVDRLGLTYQARSGRGEARLTEALTDVSLVVGERESVGIVGESGSGKTSLARCLVGLQSPTSGRIRIAGIGAEDYPALDDESRRRLRRTIQMVFQDPYSSLNPSMSIGEAIKEVLAFTGVPRQRLEDGARLLLDRVGLPTRYLQLRPRVLSGGERQRGAIARALAVRPRMLVCDEPVSALDVSVQDQILELLSDLRTREGMGLIFISHDLDVVRRMVDRIYVMHRGAIVEEGPIDQVLGRPRHPYTRTLIRSTPRGSAAWIDDRSSASGT
jgi:peptide/nickel transport system ATP-binding protein